MARRPALTAPDTATAVPRKLATAGDRNRPVARAGKRAVSFWVDPGTLLLGKQIMLVKGLTVQQAMDDAFAEWIERNRGALQ
jgi:hypothetical protein